MTRKHMDNDLMQKHNIFQFVSSDVFREALDFTWYFMEHPITQRNFWLYWHHEFPFSIVHFGHNL